MLPLRPEVGNNCGLSFLWHPGLTLVPDICCALCGGPGRSGGPDWAALGMKKEKAGLPTHLLIWEKLTLRPLEGNCVYFTGVVEHPGRRLPFPYLGVLREVLLVFGGEVKGNMQR